MMLKNDSSSREPLAAIAAHGRLLSILTQLGPLIGLMLVLILFSSLRYDRFVRFENFRIMLTQTAVVGTAAIGITLIIISGGIDLSVGSSIALTGMFVAVLLNAGYSPIVAAAGGLASGCICGGLIGILVVGRQGEVFSFAIGIALCVALHSYLDLQLWITGLIGTAVWIGGTVLSRLFLPTEPLPPFIVTLGFWGALRGLAQGIGHNTVIYPPYKSWLEGLMGVMRPTQSPPLISPGVWIMLIMGALAVLGLRYTRFGRHIFAVGSNEQTARLCGVPVDRTKVMVYVLGGLFVGLAGVLQFAFIHEGDPTTADGMELDIIAAAVIGGASLTGGQGTILGTLVGAFLMTVVANGCNKMDIPNWVQKIITGGIIALAATLDRYQHRAANGQ
jgi:ribose/xylose/arabinose/galactoside ABC-type transport system permease subunit